MDDSEFPQVDALEAKGLPQHVLWVRFSDGCEGTLDLSDMMRMPGSMVAPLRDQAFFESVFIQHGVPSWPNNFDLDVTNLYIAMRDAGTLEDRVVAAE